MQPFVSALGTAYDLTSKEISDIIWLALQMQNSDGTTETATPLEPSTAAEATDDRSRPSPEDFTSPIDRNDQPDLASQAKAAEVHLNQPNANQASFGKQLALKVPDARSLREPLSLARSLKPLLRRVVTGWSTVLDEAATVDRIAAEQLWLPVLKPALEPWLDLALVVDESASMQLWQRTIAELQRLLSHYGVFRDVRVWGLVTDAQGQVQLRPGMGAAARRQAVRRPSELLDPSGRRLILVATDCVSSGWQDGSLLPALKLWATSGPLAIVQMLPEWLWSRTGLGFASAVRLQALLPGVPNQQLIAKDLSPWDEVDLEVGLKVPVVTLEPEPFAAWTEMVMGKGGAWSPGFVFELEGVSLNGHVAQLSEAAVADSAEQRVQRFRVTASPMARRLAGLLAAAPVISLPVVRIIQDRLLSESRQVHVAEVYLGGLLKPLGEIETETTPDAVQYDFLNGVREVLLESVPTNDLVNVLEEVSKFVAERLGLSLDAFATVLRNPQQAKDRELANQSRPFAMVTAQILRQLGGEYAQFAIVLEQQFEVAPNTYTEVEFLKLYQDRLSVLQTAYRNLELSPLLHQNDLDKFKIDYAEDFLAELIQLVEDNDYVDSKIIFSGFRGCGKTTLLAEFSRSNLLNERYFTVMFSIASTLENSNVNHVNILFAIALNLMLEAEKHQVVIPKTTQSMIYRWFAEQTQTDTKELKGETSFGINLLKLVMLKLQTNASIRKEIQQRFERNASELVRELNVIAATIRVATQKDILVIVDDLDKLEPAVVRPIFRDQFKALCLPGFHIVYTIPTAVLRDREILPIVQTEVNNRIVHMPILKLFSREESHRPNAVPNPTVMNALCQVLHKRIPENVLNQQTAETLVRYSGGVLREVIRIAHECCRICLIRIRQERHNTNIIIDGHVVDEAVNNLRNEFALHLSKVDYEILFNIYQNLVPDDPTQKEFLDLMNGLYVLEYRNRKIWYDVHPIVVELLSDRGFIV